MRRHGQRGVSLLEVLAAISLFAVVASGVGALAMGSMRQTIQNRLGTVAAMLAQRQLEDLRGRPFANVVPASDQFTVDGLAYTVTTTVLNDNPAAGMKRIRVRVTWATPGGTKSHEVETIFTAVTG